MSATMTGTMLAAFRARAQRGCTKIQYMCVHSNACADSKRQVLTKIDLKLAATQNMYKSVARLGDAIAVLDKVMSTLKDKDDSMSKITQMARHIKMLISPLLQSAAGDIKFAAKDVTPMAGLLEYHQKQEIKRKRDAMDAIRKWNLSLSVEMKQIKTSPR